MTTTTAANSPAADPAATTNPTATSRRLVAVDETFKFVLRKPAVQSWEFVCTSVSVCACEC